MVTPIIDIDVSSIYEIGHWREQVVLRTMKSSSGRLLRERKKNSGEKLLRCIVKRSLSEFNPQNKNVQFVFEIRFSTRQETFHHERVERENELRIAIVFPITRK